MQVHAKGVIYLYPNARECVRLLLEQAMRDADFCAKGCDCKIPRAPCPIGECSVAVNDYANKAIQRDKDMGWMRHHRPEEDRAPDGRMLNSEYAAERISRMADPAKNKRDAK